MAELAIYGMITILLVLGIFIMFYTLRQKKKKKKYLDALNDYYSTLGVYQSLTAARAEFPQSSLEFLAIDRGLYYLDHSILMDYKTCFKIIENIFASKEIKQKHQEILEQEKAKCALLLEKQE